VGIPCVQLTTANCNDKGNNTWDIGLQAIFTILATSLNLDLTTNPSLVQVAMNIPYFIITADMGPGQNLTVVMNTNDGTDDWAYGYWPWGNSFFFMNVTGTSPGYINLATYSNQGNTYQFLYQGSRTSTIQKGNYYPLTVTAVAPIPTTTTNTYIAFLVQGP
jgi:hypothetical protein